MTARKQLPTRRAAHTVEFLLDGVRYVATVGFFESGGLAEIFLQGGKPGSAVETASRDAAITLSLALQHGTSISAIRKALTRLPDGAAAGPLGRVLDIVEAAAYA
jgi:hypothetical protein